MIAGGPVPPHKLAKAQLPPWGRFEWDTRQKVAMFHYRCQCSPETGRGGNIEVVEGGSSVTVVCERCGTVLQLRASAIVKDKGVDE